MAWTFKPNFTIRDDQTTFGNLIMDSSVVPIIENLIIDVLSETCNVTKYADQLEDKVFTNQSYSKVKEEYELIKQDIHEFSNILGHGKIFRRAEIAMNGLSYAVGSKSWIQSYIDIKNEAAMAYKLILEKKGYYNIPANKEAEWNRRYGEVAETQTRQEIEQAVLKNALSRYGDDIAAGMSMLEARDKAIRSMEDVGINSSTLKRQFGLLAATHVEHTNVEDVAESENIKTTDNNYKITIELMRETLRKIEMLPVGSDNQFMARTAIGWYFVCATRGDYGIVPLQEELKEFFQNAQALSKTDENKDLAALNFNKLINECNKEENAIIIDRNCHMIKKDLIDTYFTSIQKNDDVVSTSNVVKVDGRLLSDWCTYASQLKQVQSQYACYWNIGTLILDNISNVSGVMLDRNTIKMFNTMVQQGDLNIANMRYCVERMVDTLANDVQNSMALDYAEITVTKEWIKENVLIRE